MQPKTEKERQFLQMNRINQPSRNATGKALNYWVHLQLTYFSSVLNLVGY